MVPAKGNTTRSTLKKERVRGCVSTNERRGSTGLEYSYSNEKVLDVCKKPGEQSSRDEISTPSEMGGTGSKLQSHANVHRQCGGNTRFCWQGQKKKITTGWNGGDFAKKNK